MTPASIIDSRQAQSARLTVAQRRHKDQPTKKDISSALAAAEAMYGTILEAAIDAIITIDPKGIIQSVNSAGVRMFGYSAAEMIGRNVSMLMPKPYSVEHDSYLERYLRTGEARIIGIGREVTGRRKNGDVFPMDLAVGEARFEGRVMFTGIIRDITAVKKNAEDQQRLEAELRHAQKMEALGQLTGGIAHDFNNLLAVILGNLEMIEEEAPADGLTADAIHDAVEATKLGSQLTNRLLAFARRQPLSPQVINLNDLVIGMSDMLQRSLGGSVRINMVIAKGLWDSRADPGQIENALLNLAINARDAMPSGGDLTIETSNIPGRARMRGKDYVRLTIMDEGIGMPAEVVERAFDPFFTTKLGGKGSGLGLSMVYGFVKQSGGNISIDSTPGKGTTITIDLPRAMPAQTAVTSKESHGAGRKGTERILVVEDDARVRKVSARRLKSLGYEVIEAASGEAALNELDRRDDIDLVFSDIVMPGGMNGVRLAELAKTKSPAIKVLLTTGYPSDLLAEEPAAGDHSDAAALTLGRAAWPVLKKPHTKEELAEKVRETLDRVPSSA
jgi:PAS domain S-box-containing protein